MTAHAKTAITSRKPKALPAVHLIIRWKKTQVIGTLRSETNDCIMPISWLCCTFERRWNFCSNKCDVIPWSKLTLIIPCWNPPWSSNTWDKIIWSFCTIFVIRIDVKLMAVSVNLSLFPFNGAIYNFYEAVYFPPYKSLHHIS